MKIVTEIGIEGVADFKKSVLPIAPGVTYLYGYNALDNGNPNAAGKSVLASAASEIFYDTPMVGVKQDRSKTGSRFIKWKEGKVVHKVHSKFEGRTERIKYRVNGQVMEARTAKATRELVRKAWGLSEEEYRTYGYLDSATPHPLVRGSTTVRKAFFTSFFQLDRLDAERKLVAKRSAELKKIRAQHTELDKTFQEIKADMLTKEERLELEAKVGTLKAKIKKLRAVADEAQLAKSIADFKSWAKPHLPAFKKLVPNLDKYEEVLKSTRSQLKKAKAAQEQAEEYEVYLKELKVWKRKTADLDMSRSDEDLKQIAEKVRDYKARLAQVKSEIEDLADAREPKKVKKPEISKEEAEALRYRLKHELEHLEKFAKGVCSECGQPLKVRKASVVKAELAEAEAEVKQWRDYQLFKELMVSWTTSQADLAELKAKRKKLETFIKDNQEAVELWAKRSTLVKPEKVEAPKDYADPKQLEADLRTLEFFESHQDMLSRMDQKLEVKPFDLNLLDRLQNQLSKAEARLEVHNTVKSRASKIRNRLIELEDQLKDEQAVELLLDAYAPKAAKKMAVDEISRRLMAMTNKIAGIVFKDYVFEFVWDSQVQLLVHRPKGTTDVRKLSGAESKLFTLILVISQLLFVARSRRISLLILDEPSASFSGKTLEKFHALLAHIQKLIPSILIVTPKSEERYPGAVEYTVYRDSNGAEIRKGHPNEIQF